MRLPKARTVAYSIAVLLCGVGVFFLIAAYRYRQDFYRWKTARPIDMAIDVSQPGEFVGEFKQTCHMAAHGEGLYLVLPSNVVATMTTTNLLNDLRFVARIDDQNGEEKVREEFSGEMFSRDESLGGMIQLLRFDLFKRGDYRLTLTVTEGVAALRGIPQRLVACYVLCGCEIMPAFVLMVMGIGICVIAGLVALVTARVVKSRQKCV